jgi:hypothetical protein
MSVMAHRKNVEISSASGQMTRMTIAAAVMAIIRILRKAIVGTAKFFFRVMRTVAEARLHRTQIEVELYCNRYKHSSKNDDDLPIVR